MHTMNSMEQNNKCAPIGGAERNDIIMEERTYKTMGGAGAMNIAVGVVALVVGITSGILLIIGGAKLLAGRNKILF